MLWQTKFCDHNRYLNVYRKFKRQKLYNYKNYLNKIFLDIQQPLHNLSHFCKISCLQRQKSGHCHFCPTFTSQLSISHAIACCPKTVIVTWRNTREIRRTKVRFGIANHLAGEVWAVKCKVVLWLTN